MNFIRIAITVAMVILLGLAVAGWVWSETQAPYVRNGARMVLVPCALMAIGATTLVWGAKGRVRTSPTVEQTAERAAPKETVAPTTT